MNASPKEIVGTSNRILEIDLSTRRVMESAISQEDRVMYLGGKGLGLKLVYDRLRPGIDPLGRENILAFMMGVYMGTGAPCSARFAGVTKSPLTGIIASSTCGGPFGMALKTAGYDGLLVSGVSDKPLCLVIDSQGITFEDAANLWGKDTRQTQEALGLDPHSAALVIGPAGENKVLFANIASGHRFLGRSGYGAVMGAKKLKAIVVKGREYKIVPTYPKQFQKIRNKAFRYINRNKFLTGQYRKFGIASHVKYCNQGGILPVRNFRGGRHDQAGLVSGEAMNARYGFKPSACTPCPIACGHKGTMQDGRMLQIPEFQTAALLGPNLGIFDPDLITEWNDLCGRLGIDTISTGTTLSYVMEAKEKGLINTDLRFGCAHRVGQMLQDIAFRRGLGNELANGTRWLSQKYGGKEFAAQIKGMEMSSYDPRGAWGQALGYATANKGGHHLPGFLVAQEVLFGFLNPYTTRAKVEFLKYFEALFSALDSMVTCLFTAYAYVLEPPLVKYTPDPLLGFVMQHIPQLAIKLMDISIYSNLFEAITGIKISKSDMLRAGNRIYTLERYINTKEGISSKDDTLPARFLREAREGDPQSRAIPLDKMLLEYYKLRGYDSHGIPTPEILSQLDISLNKAWQ